jgi:hypothetical protein
VADLWRIYAVVAAEWSLAGAPGRSVRFSHWVSAGLCVDPDGEGEREDAVSEIDPQRKKVAVLAISICTLNMPFMLLMKHMQGSRHFPFFVVFYVLAMASLVAYTIVELMKYKRSVR